MIILIIALLLFGGSRLAGLGKSSGRAIREFKEETKGLSNKDKANKADANSTGATAQGPEATESDDSGRIVDAQIVEPEGPNAEVSGTANASKAESPKNDLR